MGTPAVDNTAPLRTAASCRPDQLFGVWAIEETRGRQLEALAMSADLEKLRAESAAMAERAAEEPAYQLTSDGIAVIQISGPMTKYPTSFQALFGGTATLRTRHALRAAARDPEVLGIMVVIESPGGTTAGTADLAEEIRRTDKRKPTYTFAEDLAASAGLWALSQGRKVFANAGAEIGSIGTYMVVRDTSKRYAREGVEVHVVSSAPPIKGAGVEGTEITPAQLAEWKRRVDDINALFVREVGAGRRLGAEKAQALATGQMWVAEKAREFGLIDDVVSLDEAMRRLRSEAMSEQSTKDQVAAAEAKLADERAARLKAEGELGDAKKRLEALESEKRNERLAKEAEAVGAPKEFAATLGVIEAAVAPEVYAALKTQLQAYAEQSKTGKLFDEKGTELRTGAAGTATARAQQAARAKVDAASKSGEKLSFGDALIQVFQENPDLHAEYAKESEVRV